MPVVTSTRKLAKNKNDEEYNKINEEEKIYTGKFDGDYYTKGDAKILQRRKDDVLVPETLRLKKSAKVMICKNDSNGEYVNGTIGEISGFGKISEDGVPVDVIRVKIQNTKREVEIKRATWHIQEYVKNIRNELELQNIGSYTQFPIKLAYAITIHKSQGQTWDGIYIDLGENGAFADGQVYVALSRVKTKAGIHLKRKLSESDVKVNSRIEKFLKTGERPAPLTEGLVCPPENAANALDFWKKYFPKIDDNNSNYASKGTNSNHRTSFWATLANSRLENDWYMICTDKNNKISKLFFIPAGELRREQFGIDLTARRKYSTIPNADEKFEICISDNNDDNYEEKINKEVYFGNFLHAVADYKNNRVKIDKLHNDNDEAFSVEEDDIIANQPTESKPAENLQTSDDFNMNHTNSDNKKTSINRKLAEENNQLKEKVLSLQKEMTEKCPSVKDKNTQVSTLTSSPKEEFFINGKPCNSREFAPYLWDSERDVKRTIYYADGTSKTNIWRVRNFKKYSDLSFNIKTGPLKHWKVKNIVGIKFELEI